MKRLHIPSSYIYAYGYFKPRVKRSLSINRDPLIISYGEELITYHKKGDKVKEGIVAGLLSMHSNGALHHGVLAHEHNRVTTQTPSDILKLVGPDVVGQHDQDLRVLLQKLTKLSIVSDLLLGLGLFHRHSRLLGLGVSKKEKKRNKKSESGVKSRAKTTPRRVKADNKSAPSL